MTDSHSERIEGRQAYEAAVRQLISLAQQHIAIYSGNLPSALYATPQLVDDLRSWILGTSRAQVRVLLHEPRAAVSQPNRLINLGLQLSSYFSFRDTPDQHLSIGDMVIVDDLHLLKMPASDSRVAHLWVHDGITARAALNSFDRLWEESLPSPEVRAQGVF